MKKIATLLLASVILIMAVAALQMCEDYGTYNLVYSFSFVFIAVYGICAPSTIPSKVVQTLLYGLILAAQILFNVLVIRESAGGPAWDMCRLLGVLAICVPFLVRISFFHKTKGGGSFPSAEEPAAISYGQLLCDKEEILRQADKLRKAGSILSRVELMEILYQLPRHSSFRYVNRGSLTEEYFQKANKTVDNGCIYLVITRSKSIPSDVIGLFTKREYNHVSLAFDKELDTIISYNGGQRAVPPGLNAELLAALAKRDGSAILVYRLPATAEQKRSMIQTVQKINAEGSAYNLMGLVFKGSVKPNIMFCSQFVYRMLESAGLAYFDKKAAQVAPTDFIELDYGRKLEFVRRITLDHRAD